MDKDSYEVGAVFRTVQGDFMLDNASDDFYSCFLQMTDDPADEVPLAAALQALFTYELRVNNTLFRDIADRAADLALRLAQGDDTVCSTDAQLRTWRCITGEGFFRVVPHVMAPGAGFVQYLFFNMLYLGTALAPLVHRRINNAWLNPFGPDNDGLIAALLRPLPTQDAKGRTKDHQVRDHLRRLAHLGGRHNHVGLWVPSAWNMCTAIPSWMRQAGVVTAFNATRNPTNNANWVVKAFRDSRVLHKKHTHVLHTKAKRQKRTL